MDIFRSLLPVLADGGWAESVASQPAPGSGLRFFSGNDRNRGMAAVDWLARSFSRAALSNVISGLFLE